jgi:hypothetical protein
MHLPGLVVIARQTRYNTQQPRRRTKVKESQWTLHKADCPYVQRMKRGAPLPAPAHPYPGTVACRTCKPPTSPQEAPADGQP